MAVHIREHCEIEDDILEYFALHNTFFQHQLHENTTIGIRFKKSIFEGPARRKYINRENRAVAMPNHK